MKTKIIFFLLSIILFTTIFYFYEVSVFVLSSNILLAVNVIDFDNDGLSDIEEIRIYHTNPKVADSDNDGYLDGEEVKNNYDPLQRGKRIVRNLEREKEFVQNWQGFDGRLPIPIEVNAVIYNERKIELEKQFIGEFTKKCPRLPTDKEIISSVYGPDGLLQNLDSDNDGLIDNWELKLGLSPVDKDFDKDGYLDGEEVKWGFDPKSSYPKKVEKVIKVNLREQKLAYYFNGIKLEEFLISSGIRSLPTPRGKFEVLAKIPVKTYGGRGYNFYYPNTKWNLHFTTNNLRYYIHGTYWHSNFGRPRSHGCINVSYKTMERLYEWAQIGTKVEIE